MIILAVETSCDETSIALHEDGKLIVVQTASQIKSHQTYGGVVPELASRLHVENLNYVTRKALAKAKKNLNDINLIAYTSSPGLLGCLHAGKVFSETLATFLDIPLLPMNHLHGHIYAANLEAKLTFPCLSLLISGGHSALFYLPCDLVFNKLGETLDDAVGECFDKVGRMLGFAYPAGREIDQHAQQGEPVYQLPIAKTSQPLDFSFSGLKSACANWINRHHKLLTSSPQVIDDFCASLQQTITKTIIAKVKKALSQYPQVKTLSMGGGVAANSSIRQALKDLPIQYPNLKIVLPPLIYCTDNAAMIAQLAYNTIKNKKAN